MIGYTINVEDEGYNKISNESPIAKAILGLSVGDIASVESPNGNYNVEVISADGQVVAHTQTGDVTKALVDIPAEGLTQGLYTVKISVGEMTKTIKVFVLQESYLNGTVGVKANRSFLYFCLLRTENKGQVSCVIEGNVVYILVVLLQLVLEHLQVIPGEKK